MTTTKTKLSAICAILACLSLPLLLPEFLVFQASQILVYAVAILGLNLLMGFNGQISMGHGAFYAVGAYVVAILVGHGWPYWAVLPLAAVVSFGVGFFFGKPASRLGGHYLALATFALSLAVPQLLRHPALEFWTGGSQGMYITKPEAPSFLPLNADQWLYYFVLLVAVALFFAAHNLTTGRVGRAISAIRDHPIAAESMGIPVARLKAITFGVSAMYTGVAGALSALVIQYVAPDSFSMFLSIFLFVGAVIGGARSIAGALIGGMFIVVVPNLTFEISKSATGVVYAIVLIAMMRFAPAGIWGFLRAKVEAKTRSPEEKPSAQKANVSVPIPQHDASERS